MQYEAIVIGVSAGGLPALGILLGPLPASFPLPIAVVQHRGREERALLEEVLQAKCSIRIKEADEKEAIEAGTAYLAPAGYHLLIEKDRRFSLSCEAPVHYSRPSIDILFETAAEAYGSGLAGIILTGANADGAKGIQTIRRHGGTTIAQDPNEAAFPAMPRAAIATGCVQRMLTLAGIQDFLSAIAENNMYYEQRKS